LKGWLILFWGKTLSDLDYTLQIEKTENGLHISGTINESSFSMTTVVEGDKITIDSTLENVNEDQGAVIKVGSPQSIVPLGENTEEVANHTPAGEGKRNPQIPLHSVTLTLRILTTLVDPYE
jgi:hypothetical protein